MNTALLCTKGQMYLILSKEVKSCLGHLVYKTWPDGNATIVLSNVNTAPYVVSSWLLPFAVDFGMNSAAESCSLCPEMPLCQPDQVSNKTEGGLSLSAL